MNLPNFLSISRVFLIIPTIIFFEYYLYSLSILTFTFAAMTDYLDGYFARKNKLSSDLGALLDLLADKIFVSILLIWMTFNFNDSFILISSILIISREISISYLRLFIVSKSKDIREVNPDFLGKFKTTFQMLGLGFILISPLMPDLIFNIGLFMLLSSAAISWYSLLRYLNKWNV